MKTLSIREMRAALTRLDEILAGEAEILITRRGKGVARLLPVRRRTAVRSHADLRSAMPRLKVGSEVYLRADRESR